MTYNVFSGTLNPTHFTSRMADIQPATAEIRRRRKKEEQTTGQKYNGLPYSIGRPKKVR